MEIKRPLLLISNDDGYQSKGIRSLVEMLSDYGDIIVCAPEAARSGLLLCLLRHHPVTAPLWNRGTARG